MLAGFRICAAVVLSLLPRRFRYSAAVALARAFPRRLRHRYSPRFERRPGISSLREIILGVILDALDRSHVRYDPKLDVRGLDTLREKLAERHGVLLVGTHANGVLSRLALRAMHDASVPITLIAISEQFPIGGTGFDMPAVVPGPTFMIPLRTKLRRGEMVGAMVDAYAASNQHSIELRIATGSVWISDGLFRLAAACSAAIVFIAAHLEDDGRIVLAFRSAVGEADPDHSHEEFVSYTEQHLASDADPDSVPGLTGSQAHRLTGSQAHRLTGLQETGPR